MVKITRSTYYGNHYSLIGSTSNLSMFVQLLDEDKVFEYNVGRGIKKTEFIDLHVHGSGKIDLEGPLKDYLHCVWGNWKAGLWQDGLLFAKYKTEELDNKNVDRGEDETSSFL